MEDEMRELYNELLKKEMGNLNKMTIGSDEYDKASESFARLYALALQDLRDQATYVDQMNKDDLDQKKFNFEKDHKIAELRELIKNNYLQFGLGILTTAAFLALKHYWYGKGFKFEETGTFTSNTFREIKNSKKP